MNFLEKYLRDNPTIYHISVGIYRKYVNTPSTYNAYVHWDDGDCTSGWGKTQELAIKAAIKEYTK